MERSEGERRAAKRPADQPEAQRIGGHTGPGAFGMGLVRRVDLPEARRSGLQKG